MCTFREKYINLPGIADSSKKDLHKNVKKKNAREKLFTLCENTWCTLLQGCFVASWWELFYIFVVPSGA